MRARVIVVIALLGVASLAGCSAPSPDGTRRGTDPATEACDYPIDLSERADASMVTLRVAHAGEGFAVASIRYEIRVSGQTEPFAQGPLESAANNSSGGVRFVDSPPSAILSEGDELQIATTEGVIADLIRGGVVIGTSGRCL